MVPGHLLPASIQRSSRSADSLCLSYTVLALLSSRSTKVATSPSLRELLHFPSRQTQPQDQPSPLSPGHVFIALHLSGFDRSVAQRDVL